MYKEPKIIGIFNTKQLQFIILAGFLTSLVTFLSGAMWQLVLIAGSCGCFIGYVVAIMFLGKNTSLVDFKKKLSATAKGSLEHREVIALIKTEISHLQHQHEVTPDENLEKRIKELEHLVTRTHS